MSSHRKWNWQQEDWPKFCYVSTKLQSLEAEFLQQSGVFLGAIRHVKDDEKQGLVVELISDEALNTSEIEGELLNRDSLQSSILQNFGLTTDHRKVPPAEQGIAQMMVEIYRQFDTPLTDPLLFHWHELLMNGRRDLRNIGAYRSNPEPMQVVSGPIHSPVVHFEAPPSSDVPKEMASFIRWFIDSAPTGRNPLPILTRAAIAHLYFVSVHPFEDGNGRIGRAIVEKALSEGLGQATLIALSHVINRERKKYYEMLERSNKQNEISEWLIYFAETIVEAQGRAQKLLDFILAKTKYYQQFGSHFNDRQAKVIARMMREGPDGFKGGLSAEKYLSISGTSRATATRDLHDLLELGALTRTGTLKSTRYFLPITANF